MRALASSSGGLRAAASSSGAGRPKNYNNGLCPFKLRSLKSSTNAFFGSHINQNARVCEEAQVAHHTARKENQVSAACIDARD